MLELARSFMSLRPPIILATTVLALIGCGRPNPDSQPATDASRPNPPREDMETPILKPPELSASMQTGESDSVQTVIVTITNPNDPAISQIWYSAGGKAASSHEATTIASFSAPEIPRDIALEAEIRPKSSPGAAKPSKRVVTTAGELLGQ